MALKAVLKVKPIHLQLVMNEIITFMTAFLS